MAKQLINPPNVAQVQKKFGYSQAIKAGNTIYLAGQVAWDEKGNLVGKDDPVAQMRQIYENIKRILAACGGKMTDIVKINYFCKDLKTMIPTAPVFKEYFGDYTPPCTDIQVARLWDTDFYFEVDVIAMVD